MTIPTRRSGGASAKSPCDSNLRQARLDGNAIERLVDHPAYDDQPSLSPDETHLAFVSSRSGDADIWILNLATRELRNLTRHPAGNFCPAWSPDGQWIAFSSDRDGTRSRNPGGFVLRQSTDIYVARVDGTELRRITHSGRFAGSPAWSPDGRHLAFYEAGPEDVDRITAVRGLRGNTQIAIIDADNGEYRVLTNGPGEKVSPRWLTKDRIGYASTGTEGGVEIVTDGGAIAAARGDVRSPGWSADGGKMVFHRDVESTWPPFQRWHSKDSQFQLVRTGVFPAYSPTGDRFICNDGPGAIISKHILSVNRDGTGPRVFIDAGDKNAIAAAWSPDGRHVAFSYGRYFQSTLGPAVGDIAIVDHNGKNLKVLTSGMGNAGFSSWSPDATQIVYRESSASSRGLFIITLATGETRALATGLSRDNFPAWSPQGDRIAFTAYRDDNYDIYTIKPDGTDLRQLTYAPGNDAHCAWSPDGEWIAFATASQGFKDETVLHPRNAQASGEIAVMRADGSDVRILTDNPFEEGTVAWAPR